MVSESYSPLTDSEPVSRPGAMRVGPVNRTEIQATLVIRSQPDRSVLLDAPIQHAQYLTAREFQEQYGPRSEDLDLVKAFGENNGLEVEVRPEESSVILRGTADEFSHAFRVSLFEYQQSGVRYLAHEDPLRIPSNLSGIIEAVLGLDESPVFTTHAARGFTTHAAVVAHDNGKSVDPRDIARLYGFPKRTTGAGQRIALIQFGGGYHQRDLTRYFEDNNLSGENIRRVSIRNYKNSPLEPNIVKGYIESLPPLASPTRRNLTNSQIAGPRSPAQITAIWGTIEATVDIELLRTFAPDAEIVVYMAPPDKQGIYEALKRAVNSEPPPTVISTSWGAIEAQLTTPYIDAVNKILLQAARQGITVCCSSGDYGNYASKNNGIRSVEFPASSPYVLGCGGTHLTIEGNRFTERIWTEDILSPNGDVLMKSGGGLSRFGAPPWQTNAVRKDRRRGVPDVCAKADLAGGYKTFIAGIHVPMGGTSVASPLWAALIACLSEKTGGKTGHPVGFLPPRLYSLAFHATTNPIPHGKRRGWRKFVGLGSPRGVELLEALTRLNGGQR